jgi:hypothetical protein
MIEQAISRHRRSIRLKGYDYAREGAYFVTVCTKHGACHFGKVKDDVIELSKIEIWQREFGMKSQGTSITAD